MNVAITVIAALAVSVAAYQAAPSGGEPARDARGYKVVSNPAQVPEGANRTDVTTPAPDPSQVFAPRPSPGDYPPCTREVTDNCKQVHERQRPR